MDINSNYLALGIVIQIKTILECTEVECVEIILNSLGGKEVKKLF